MNLTVKRKIMLFFLLLPFFKPGYISNNIPILSKAYNLMLILSCCIICILLFTNKKISKISIAIIIYKVILISITFIKNGDIKNAVFNSLYIIFLSLLIDMYIRIDAKNFLSVILLVFEMLIYINFVTILMFPNGMYETRFVENFFLGYDNVTIIYILPALCISITYSYIIGKKLSNRTKILIIVSALTTILRWSVTNLIAILILIMFITIPRVFNNTRIFNILNYYICGIISFVSIIIFRIQETFEYIIVNVLHKSITFTGRIKIWDRNLEYIEQSPIIGYGMEDENLRVLNNYGFSHAHNQILEILYQGGILLLLSYIYIYIIVAKKLMKYKENKFSKLISIFILMLLVLMLMDVFRIDYMWILFILGYNVNIIINQEKIYKEPNDVNNTK